MNEMTVQSENTECLCLGDLVQIDDKIWRICNNDENYVIAICCETRWVETFDQADFLKRMGSGEFVRMDKISRSRCIPSVSEEEMQKINDRVAVLDYVLDQYYPNWERMFQRTVKKSVLIEAAKELGINDKYFNRILKRYLLSGRDKFSLIDQRHNRTGKAHTRIPTGPRFKNGKKSVVENNEVLEAQMQEALAEFKKTLSVQAAWDVVKKYYRIPVTVNGKTVMALPSHEQYPSYKRVYGYISAHLGGLTVKDYIKTPMARRNARPLAGNSQYGVRTIGQTYQLDECEIPIHIVSETDPSKVIGKAVVYIAIDVKANIVVGAYVGFQNNSYSGFCALLSSMLEDHNNQTEPYGVKCTPYEFPSLVLPNEIYCDHGSEYESKALEAACKDLGIKLHLVPVGTGSMKGLVESFFHRLQASMRKDIHGAGMLPIRARMTPKTVKQAKEKACLTLSDLRRIVYLYIVDINQRPVNIDPDAEMVADALMMTPAEIYKYEKTRFDPTNVTPENRDSIHFALLNRDRETDFSISRAGITYKNDGLHFFVDEEWFRDMVMDPKCHRRVIVRYNNNDLSCVYVSYNGEIHRVPIAVRRENLLTFIGKTWDQYEAQRKQFNDSQDLAGRIADASKSDASDAVRETVRRAKNLSRNTKKSIKDMKENRRMERSAVETSPDEARNRMLGEVGKHHTELPGKNDVPIDAEFFETDYEETVFSGEEAGDGQAESDRISSILGDDAYGKYTDPTKIDEDMMQRLISMWGQT